MSDDINIPINNSLYIDSTIPDDHSLLEIARRIRVD